MANFDNLSKLPASGIKLDAGTLEADTDGDLKPVGTQHAHVANPTGGATVDAEARAAINEILGILEDKGFMASS